MSRDLNAFHAVVGADDATAAAAAFAAQRKQAQPAPSTGEPMSWQAIAGLALGVLAVAALLPKFLKD